jgi:hypothetical protein
LYFRETKKKNELSSKLAEEGNNQDQSRNKWNANNKHNRKCEDLKQIQIIKSEMKKETYSIEMQRIIKRLLGTTDRIREYICKPYIKYV